MNREVIKHVSSYQIVLKLLADAIDYMCVAELIILLLWIVGGG